MIRSGDAFLLSFATASFHLTTSTSDIATSSSSSTQTQHLNIDLPIARTVRKQTRSRTSPRPGQKLPTSSYEIERDPSRGLVQTSGGKDWNNVSLNLSSYHPNYPTKAGVGGDAHSNRLDSFWTSNREAVAIVGGVIGFWGGVFLLGIVYLIFVCVRRIRKGLHRSANGGSAAAGQRPPIRDDQMPRERKRRAHHYQNFYGSGSRSGFGGRSEGDSGISLTRLGFGGGGGRGEGGFSTAMYPSSGGGARIKFGGVSFRNRDMHEPVASSQL